LSSSRKLRETTGNSEKLRETQETPGIYGNPSLRETLGNSGKLRETPGTPGNSGNLWKPLITRNFGEKSENLDATWNITL
jgi:hypothetical protein